MFHLSKNHAFFQRADMTSTIDILSGQSLSIYILGGGLGGWPNYLLLMFPMHPHLDYLHFIPSFFYISCLEARSIISKIRYHTVVYYHLDQPLYVCFQTVKSF